jgi:phosphoglycolate phosphatase
MIEHLRPGAHARGAHVVLFDFDGTISLIRAGWMDVMVPMMVEILLDLKSGESEAKLRAIVEEFVGRLTGKQTMYQKIELAENVKARGNPPDPLVYKKQYLDLLHVIVCHRLRRVGIRCGVIRKVSRARCARAPLIR